jgi:hypothetical protein
MTTESDNLDRLGNQLQPGDPVTVRVGKAKVDGELVEIGNGPWRGIYMVGFADGVRPFNRLEIELREPELFEGILK